MYRPYLVFFLQESGLADFLLVLNFYFFNRKSDLKKLDLDIL